MSIISSYLDGCGDAEHFEEEERARAKELNAVLAQARTNGLNINPELIPARTRLMLEGARGEVGKNPALAKRGRGRIR